MSGNPVLLGFFDGSNGSRYLMLVNRSFEKDAKIRITPAVGISLTEICKTIGQTLNPMIMTRGAYSLEFRPGDGRFFQITNKQNQ